MISAKPGCKCTVEVYFLLACTLLCLFYGIFFQPIQFGDSGGYIMLAEQFLGTDTYNIDLSNRSPLYSMLLAIFIKIFGMQHYLPYVIYFQFLLVLVAGLMIYKIFSGFIASRYIPVFIGLIFFLNISTITFGFLILTETLTLFLFISIAYLLSRHPATMRKKVSVFSLGVLSGLLILARFNTLFIPLCIIFCIFWLHFLEYRWKKIATLLFHLLVFLAPLFVILNAWCYRNYRVYNFYFLFPPAYGNQRFIEPALVDEDTKVSPEYEVILAIFLDAKKEYQQKKILIQKDSLLRYLPIDIPHEITSGYKIYKIARQRLLEYFKIEESENPAFLLSDKLKVFFKEVADQNKLNLLLLRFYSLINSFRVSIARLEIDPGMNLNVLPVSVFVFYKIAFFILFSSFFVITIFYIVSLFKNKEILDKKNYVPVTLLVLIFHFPLINFLAATISDANRFKYPAEPLIMGMLVYYILYFISKKRKKSYSK